MVRGLDYYNHTIFEFITEIEGNDLTVCAGGRYDGLVAYFGGPETAGFGFGLGIERLLLILEKQGVALPHRKRPRCLYRSLGRRGKCQGFGIGTGSSPTRFQSRA